ncbi:MAG: GNVR domain-containing protein, partial [Anaerolineae bacterium]
KAPLPEMAADLVNAWVDVLVEEGNRLYGGSEEDVAFFGEQLQQAQTALDAIEAAQVEFEARDRSSIVQAQLDSLRQTQADYLATQRRITYLVQNIQGLRGQLAEEPGDQPVSLGDSLTTLFLQIKTFDAESSTPIQLQFDSAAAVSEKTLAEQIDFLDNLAATLEERSGGIDERLAELEPLILTSQQTLQEIRVENNRLERAQRVAEETYVTLARKADEARIAAQEDKGSLQVGSYAAVPRREAGPRRLTLMAAAGMLGLMVGIAGVLVIDFWRQGRG